MKIAILKERRPHETRVAASVETVQKFADLGVDVCIEKGATGIQYPRFGVQGRGREHRVIGTGRT